MELSEADITSPSEVISQAGNELSCSPKVERFSSNGLHLNWLDKRNS